jgi:NAD(P)H-hydrate epimerase
MDMKIPNLTTEQMIEVDRLMIEEYGILLIQMMENAGRALAILAQRMLNKVFNDRKIVILCGTGNNGGGGMVAARHLHNWGAQVWTLLVGDQKSLKEVPSNQWDILQKMGLSGIKPASNLPEQPDLIIDAIIGYGLHGNPRGAAVDWINWGNTQECAILALDTPSGLDTTSGIPGSPCIRATATLTLGLPKTGLHSPKAKPYVGDLYLADIGVPPELYRRIGLQVKAIFTKDTIIRVS